MHSTSWGTICTASEKAGEELGNEADTREEPKNGSLTSHVETLSGHHSPSTWSTPRTSSFHSDFDQEVEKNPLQSRPVQPWR